MMDDHRQNISEAQAAVFGELHADQDYPQMAEIIARHMLRGTHARLSINSMTHDDRGQIISIRTQAVASSERLYPNDQNFTVSWTGFSQALRQTVENGEALARGSMSAETPESLGEDFYQWVKDNGVESLLNIPLMLDGKPLGLLSVFSRENLTFAAEWVNAFRNIGNLVSTLLHVRRLTTEAQTARSIADHLVLSSRLVTTADSHDDMAQAAVYTIARSMAGVALTLFDHPLDAAETPTSRAVVALGQVDGPLVMKEIEYTSDMPQEELLKQLWRGQPVIIEEPLESSFVLSPQVYETYIAGEIHWLAAFGLRAGDQVLGTLEVLHHVPYSLSSEEIDAYITLADQIGISIRGRQLLQQTSETLDEVQALYEVNRTMLSAQDALDVLRGLRAHIAPDAMSVAHIAVEGDEEHLGIFVLRDVISGDEERVMNLPAAQGANTRDYWRRRDLPLIFVEDASQSPAEVPTALVTYIKEQQAGSYVLLPVYQRGQLANVVLVLYAAPRPFPPRTRRLYDALRDQISIVLQSQSLLQEAQHSAARLNDQVRVLEVLNRLATDISLAPDEQILLDESCRAMVEALEVDHSAVTLLEAAHTVAVVRGEYPTTPLKGARFSTANNLLRARFAQNTEPLVIEDVGTSNFLDETERQNFAMRGVKKVLLVPLTDADGRQLGSFSINVSDASRSFTPGMMNVAQTIGAQMALGLQNARLLTDAERRSEQLQRVSHFGQALQATLDLRHIVETALKESARIMTSERMVIALADEYDGRLRIVAGHANGQNFVTLNSGTVIEGERSVIAQVWQSGDALNIPDVQEADDPEAVYAVLPEVRSVLVTPIDAPGQWQRLGVISVGHSHAHTYSDTDQFILQQMARQLATSIENARVYNHSQRVAKNESLVNDISARLLQQVDIDGMLNVTMNELGKALGARRGRIRLGTATEGDEK